MRFPIVKWIQGGVIIFNDFRKAFDSINQDRVFDTIGAYWIPINVIDANQVMYKETFALVLTPEGEKLSRSRLTLVF